MKMIVLRKLDGLPVAVPIDRIVAVTQAETLRDTLTHVIVDAGTPYVIEVADDPNHIGSLIRRVEPGTVAVG